MCSHARTSKDSFRQTSRNPESRKIVVRKKKVTNSKVNGMMTAKSDDECPRLSRRNQFCGAGVDEAICLSSSLQEFSRRLIGQWKKGRSEDQDQFFDSFFMLVGQISYFPGHIKWNYFDNLNIILKIEKGRTGGYKNGSQGKDLCN